MGGCPWYLLSGVGHPGDWRSSCSRSGVGLHRLGFQPAEPASGAGRQQSVTLVAGLRLVGAERDARGLQVLHHPVHADALVAPARLLLARHVDRRRAPLRGAGRWAASGC